MKDKLLKEYKINESVYIIHHTLDALYQKFCGSIPKELETKIINIIIETRELIVDKTKIKGYEIVNEDYIWKVEYQKTDN